MSVRALILDARLNAGLTQKQLARAAGTSQPAVARYERGVATPSLPTLERLLGACRRKLVIDSVALSPADAAPLSDSRALPATTGHRLRGVRRALLGAAHSHGVRRVRVFGSTARGDAGQGSDLDLLVDLAPGRTLIDLTAFKHDAERLTGVPVDVAIEGMLKPHVLESAKSDLVPL